MLARQIINWLKKNWYMIWCEEQRKMFVFNNFVWVTAKSTESLHEPEISASYRYNRADKGEGLIHIDIELGLDYIDDPTTWKQHFMRSLSLLSVMLRKSLRHELEHARQNQLEQQGKASPKLSGAGYADSNYVGYLLQPHEVAAWVVAMHKQAKYDKADLLDVMTDQLMNFYYDDGIMPLGDLLRVFDAWIEYARKRFPAIVRKDDHGLGFDQQIAMHRKILTQWFAKNVGEQ